MIRFIDLGKQIAVDENDPEYHRQFAFFNTINDKFISIDGEQVWDTWKEFELAFNETFDIEITENKQLFDRFKTLCPTWVFE